MKRWFASLGLFVISVVIACSSSSSRPERVSQQGEALTGVGKAIATGVGHTCELMSDGTVQCWGDNSYGELGLGVSGGTHTTPATVQGLGQAATAISGSSTLMCAILADQTVKCWGGGYGPTPQAISGVTGAVSISASGASWTHACALLSTGRHGEVLGRQRLGRPRHRKLHRARFVSLSLQRLAVFEQPDAGLHVEQRRRARRG